MYENSKRFEEGIDACEKMIKIWPNDSYPKTRKIAFEKKRK